MQIDPDQTPRLSMPLLWDAMHTKHVKTDFKCSAVCSPNFKVNTITSTQSQFSSVNLHSHLYNWNRQETTGIISTSGSFQLSEINPFIPSVPFKGIFANSVNPEQTPQNAVSDQGLHCLH